MNNKQLQGGTALLILGLVMITGFFIEKYKYNDCKKVGHTTLYCIFNMGK